MDPFGTKFIGNSQLCKNHSWRRIFLELGMEYALFFCRAVSLELLLGMILALLLNRKNTGGRGVYRTLMMLPIIMTPIAVAYMWRVIYYARYGNFELPPFLDRDRMGRNGLQTFIGPCLLSSSSMSGSGSPLWP